MEEILHQLIDSLSQYLQGFYTSQVVVGDFFHQQYHPYIQWDGESQNFPTSRARNDGGGRRSILKKLPCLRCGKYCKKQTSRNGRGENGNLKTILLQKKTHGLRRKDHVEAIKICWGACKIGNSESQVFLLF